MGAHGRTWARSRGGISARTRLGRVAAGTPAAYASRGRRRTGRGWWASHHRRGLPEAPTLIGSKHTGGDVGELLGCVTKASSMHHFVVDGQAMPGAMLGAKGIYSFTANLNPVWSVEFWAACARGDAGEAARRKLLEARFFDAWHASWGDVTASQSLAKMATRCGIAPEMSLRVRAPYLAGTESQVDALRRLLDGEFLEFRYRPE